MPKELKEITRFTAGTYSSPEEEDIPDNAASYSLDVDNYGTDGRLNGRANETSYTSGGFQNAEASDSTPTAHSDNVLFPVYTSGDLNSKYFYLNSPDNRYYIWFNENSLGVNPNILGRTGIKVDIPDGDGTLDVQATLALNTKDIVVTNTDYTASIVVYSGFVRFICGINGEVLDGNGFEDPLNIMYSVSSFSVGKPYSIDSKMMNLINNGDRKDLIYYNNSQDSMSVIQDLYGTPNKVVLNRKLNLPDGANLTSISNNKEVHIGSSSTTMTPKWAGYASHKRFGADQSDVFICEEDELLSPSAYSTLKSFTQIIRTPGDLAHLYAIKRGENYIYQIEYDSSDGTTMGNVIASERLDFKVDYITPCFSHINDEAYSTSDSYVWVYSSGDPDASDVNYGKFDSIDYGDSDENANALSGTIYKLKMQTYSSGFANWTDGYEITVKKELPIFWESNREPYWSPGSNTEGTPDYNTTGNARIGDMLETWDPTGNVGRLWLMFIPTKTTEEVEDYFNYQTDKDKVRRWLYSSNEDTSIIDEASGLVSSGLTFNDKSPPTWALETREDETADWHIYKFFGELTLSDIGTTDFAVSDANSKVYLKTGFNSDDNTDTEKTFIVDSFDTTGGDATLSQTTYTYTIASKMMAPLTHNIFNNPIHNRFCPLEYGLFDCSNHFQSTTATEHNVGVFLKFGSGGLNGTPDSPESLNYQEMVIRNKLEVTQHIATIVDEFSDLNGDFNTDNYRYFGDITNGDTNMDFIGANNALAYWTVSYEGNYGACQAFDDVTSGGPNEFINHPEIDGSDLTFRAGSYASNTVLKVLKVQANNHPSSIKSPSPNNWMGAHSCVMAGTSIQVYVADDNLGANTLAYMVRDPSDAEASWISILDITDSQNSITGGNNLLNPYNGITVSGRFKSNHMIKFSGSSVNINKDTHKPKILSPVFTLDTYASGGLPDTNKTGTGNFNLRIPILDREGDISFYVLDLNTGYSVTGNQITYNFPDSLIPGDGDAFGMQNFGIDGTSSSSFSFQSGSSYISSITEGGSGSTFKSSSTYYYKCSFLYDGYQESPLTTGSWELSPSADSSDLSITLTLMNVPKRVSHINLYRTDSQDKLYRLIKSFELDNTWAYNTGLDDIDIWERVLLDRGSSGPSYDAINGISESLKRTIVHYGISTKLNNTLYAGQCYHPNVINADNFIFKSKPGNYSQFDWSNDYVKLPVKPTAIQGYRGRIYAFDEGNMFVLSYNLIIEDIYEGIGCLNNNTILSIDSGMFFMDLNHVYMQAQGYPRIISRAIENDFSGNSLGLNDLVKPSIFTPIMSYDSAKNSVYIFCSADASSYYIWVYNISLDRWDLWSGYNVQSSVNGKDGESLISNNSSEALQQIARATSNKAWSWWSKDFTFGHNTQSKKFKRLAITGNPTGVIDTNVSVLNNGSATTETGTVSSIKIPTNSNGEKFQIRFNAQTDYISAFGMIFRRKPIK